MCSARRYGSTDMQHDPFRSGHDLDLRSNFQVDLSRSNYSSFDASWREEHDAGKSKLVQGLGQKLLQKNCFRKNRLFLQFLPPAGKTVDVRSNLRELLRKGVNRAIECAFPRRCSSIGSRVMRWLLGNFRHSTWKSAKFCLQWPLVTWPLTWPKNWPKWFRHYFWRSFERRLPRIATWPRSRVTRGGVQTPPPPAGRGNPGPPAGRGLTFALVGGGHFGPPLWFFSDNSETTWVSALKLCIAVYSTFLHHVLFLGVRVRSGQVTRSPKLTPPLKKFKALSKAQLLSDRCKIYSTWRCHSALQNGYLGFFINVT